MRVVAATNRDLDRRSPTRRFRGRSVLPAERRSRSGLPPLRERAEDIPLLVKHFLAQFQRKLAKPLKG